MTSVNAAAARLAAELFTSRDRYLAEGDFVRAAKAERAGLCAAEFAAMARPGLVALNALIDREFELARSSVDQSLAHHAAAARLTELAQGLWPDVAAA